MKIKNRDIGRAVTVKWDDVGRQDGILVDLDLTNRRARVFEFSGGLRLVDLGQITDIRNRIMAQ